MMMMISAFFKMISFRNGNRCKYGESRHKSSLLARSHTAHANVQARLEIGIEPEKVFDILAADQLLIFGCYCKVAVSVLFPFCSSPCKQEFLVEKLKDVQFVIFLRLWPESAKSSGDLIRPFFPCQPGAYKWGLINCAISRLSCSQDC